MKDKNLPLDNNTQSLEELTNDANNIIESLENEKDLQNSIDSYQKLLKLNNTIEKKFQKNSKKINEKTKKKIQNIIKKKMKNKLIKIANDTNLFLKNFIKKQKKTELIISYELWFFLGEKKLDLKILIDIGSLFKIDYKTLIIIGAAVECIHAYSLIHDDLTLYG